MAVAVSVSAGVNEEVTIGVPRCWPPWCDGRGRASGWYNAIKTHIQICALLITIQHDSLKPLVALTGASGTHVRVHQLVAARILHGEHITVRPIHPHPILSPGVKLKNRYNPLLFVNVSSMGSGCPWHSWHRVASARSPALVPPAPGCRSYSGHSTRNPQCWLSPASTSPWRSP